MKSLLNGQEGLGEIVELVRSHFKVRDYYVRAEGPIEFEILKQEKLKESFVKLVGALKPNYIAFLRGSGDTLNLFVLKAPPPKTFKRRTPLILLIATIATVASDGFIRSANLPGYSTPMMVIFYTLGVLGIIGIHELGHKLVSARRAVKSSLPYFIPGIPGALPTFGAVIASAEPPINRDSLFDLGISGPLSGLAVSFTVAVFGGLTSIAVPIETLEKYVEAGSIQLIAKMDLLNELLLRFFAPRGEGTGLILSPLVFASSLGFLITFLNLMPAWQLDGGHLARAFFGPARHRLATFVSVLVLFALGFQLMAILVLILSLRSPEMAPLDDVSSLSRGRKALLFCMWVLAALLYVTTIMNNPFFFR